MLNFNKKKYVSFDNLKSFNGLLQSSLKEKLDGYKSETDAKVQKKFNELSGKVQTDSEVIDARKGEASLRAKIDVIDDDIKNVSSQLEHIANKFKKGKCLNVSEIGLKNDVDIDNSYKLVEFINSIQGDCTLLFTDGFYTFKSSLDLPSNIDIMITKGAGLNISQGFTFKINGNVVADNYLIFKGQGAVDLNNTSSKINVGWFEGESLNKKWDKIRKSFISWSQYDLVIPKPYPNQEGAMYYQESQKSRWVWKLDDTFIFDDKCNCGTIWCYSEICPVGTIDIGMLFDDDDKVENIKFPIGLSLVGCESENNYFKTALEIRGIARLHIQGKLDIQYCETGILFGGERQTREIGQCIFENTHIAFSSLNAIKLDAFSNEILNVYFGDLVIEANSKPHIDNILIDGKVLDVYFRNIYTQVIKSGVNVPASVVIIKPNAYGVCKNITIDNMWVAEVSNYAIRTTQGEGIPSLSEEVKLGFIHVDNGDGLNLDYVKHLIVYKGVNPATSILIGSNSQYVNLNLGNRCPLITDNGMGTIINNMGAKPFSTGNYPDVNLFKKGNMIFNSYDNSVWVRTNTTGNGENDFIKLSN